MGIVHNYNLRYHILSKKKTEKELCTLLVKIYYKLIVVGSYIHGIQDKVCWQCLLRLMRQQLCWSSFS